jgi:cytochrome P450
MTDAAETALDPFLEAVSAPDPYPVVHRARAQDPVHWVPGLELWWVTRHDDVKRLFHDPEHVTNDRRAWEKHVPRSGSDFLRWVEDHGLFALPPDEHARIRRLVSAAFTPRAVQRMEAQVREVVERFAAPLRGRTGEVVDLLDGFANPIPNAVISRLTGVPPGEDEVRFRRTAQRMIQGFFSLGDAALQQEAAQAFLEIAEQVRAMVRERRGEPGEDLVSDLIRAQEADDRLVDDEIVMLITALLGAGSETTALGGQIAIRALLLHPGVMEQLRASPELVPGAVNEILRWGFGGPAGLPRYALRDFELRGRPIRRGQMLLLSLGGANRDPAVFSDPDRLDVARDCRDSMIFGHGPHYCLGAHLARQEMACMIEAFLAIAPPGSRFREDLVRRQRMGLFQRSLNLPVEIAG